MGVGVIVGVAVACTVVVSLVVVVVCVIVVVSLFCDAEVIVVPAMTSAGVVTNGVNCPVLYNIRTITAAAATVTPSKTGHMRCISVGDF